MLGESSHIQFCYRTEQVLTYSFCSRMLGESSHIQLLLQDRESSHIQLLLQDRESSHIQLLLQGRVSVHIQLLFKDNKFFIPPLSNIHGWEFAHSLVLLKSNERLWAIRSDRSRTNCEQISQVTHIKRATVSELLSSLMTNERLWAISSGGSW